MSSRALAQRRQAQADHVEAVEQVLAERARLDALLEVLVRRGDHAHVAALSACGRRRGRTGRRTSTRSSRVCRSSGMSPISSRKSVPPSACSKRPRRVVCAPVNAPRSWPKSSDSSRSFGIAAVLIATNGPLARGLCLWSASRDEFLARARLAGDQNRDDALAEPPDRAEDLLHRRRLAEDLGHLRRRRVGSPPSRRLSSTARRIRSTAWSTSKGLGRYSKAPPWNARTALSRSEYAVMMMTGSAVLGLDLLQQLDARAARHADVRDQHLRRTVARARRARRARCVKLAPRTLRGSAPSRTPSGSTDRRRRSR